MNNYLCLIRLSDGLQCLNVIISLCCTVHVTGMLSFWFVWTCVSVVFAPERKPARTPMPSAMTVLPRPMALTLLLRSCGTEWQLAPCSPLSVTDCSVPGVFLCRCFGERMFSLPLMPKVLCVYWSHASFLCRHTFAQVAALRQHPTVPEGSLSWGWRSDWRSWRAVGLQGRWESTSYVSYPVICWKM